MKLYISGVVLQVSVKITIREELAEKMFIIQSLHVALEVWGSIFCFIMAMYMFISKKFTAVKFRIIMYMQLACAFLLIMDAYAWGFSGNIDATGYYMVRISNFCIFAVTQVIVTVFHAFVCSLLFEKPKDGIKVKRPKRVYAAFIIGSIGLVLVIISQFTDLYYYIDAANYYHRSALYPVSLIMPVLSGIIDLSLIIEFRKRVNQAIFISMLIYIQLPLLTTVIMVFFYDIAFTNVTIAISVTAMFITSIAEYGSGSE